MNSLFKIICLFCFVFFVGCNSKHSQSNNKKKIFSRDKCQTLLDSNSIEKHKAVDILTTEKLYLEVEARRDNSLKLGSDPSTTEKVYAEMINNNENKFIIQYQKQRIISITNRLFNSKDEIIAYKVFFFDENNCCYFYTNRGIGDEYSNEYISMDSIIVKTNFKMKPVVLDDLQKQQIIESAKASLDSIMQYFPEFKYSFNWK